MGGASGADDAMYDCSQRHDDICNHSEGRRRSVAPSRRRQSAGLRNCQLAGGKHATQRATDIWKQTLKQYEEPRIAGPIAGSPPLKMDILLGQRSFD